MVLKLKWCVVIFTMFCSSSYTSWAGDIKKITFKISEDNICEDVPLRFLKVGEKFRIHVNSLGKYLHNVARCFKTLAVAEDFVETELKKQTQYPYGYTSIHDVTVTRPGNWKYECIFYFHACKFEKNKCWYWSWYEDVGVKCSSQVHVENVVQPSGYLTANTKNFPSSAEEYIYKFQDGETANFTCHMTTGNSANLKYTEKGGNSTSKRETDSVSIYMELGVKNNDTTLDCTITGDNSLEQVIKLRLIAEEDGGIWIVVSSVILFALLIAVGLCIVLTYKKRQRLPKNDLSLVALPASQPAIPTSIPRADDDSTYAELYSLTNEQTKEPINAQEDANEEHTYLNSQQLNNEPTYVSVHSNAPNYVAVHNSEPNFASVKNCELNFASVKNCEPNFASVKNIEPNFASVKKCEPASVQNCSPESDENVSLQAPGPSYVNLTCVKYQNHNNLNIKDTNKNYDTKTSKIDKNKTDSNSHEGGSKQIYSEIEKTSEVTYAELCHDNTNLNDFATKVPVSTDIHESKCKSRDYENADVNNFIEPAYCEIIPTKK